MNTITSLRKDVQKYIETADERVVKMVHAMLEADSKTDLLFKFPMADKNAPKKMQFLFQKKAPAQATHQN